MFEENQAKLKETNASRYHLEMNFVTYVSVDQMIQDGLLKDRGDLWTTDRYGQRIRIINRTQRILQNICSQANWKASLVTVGVQRMKRISLVLQTSKNIQRNQIRFVDHYDLLFVANA